MVRLSDQRDEEQGTGRTMRRVAGAALAVLLIAGGAYVILNLDATPPTPQEQAPFQVVLTPPPPPPPPPEIKPPPPEEMKEVEPVEEEELVEPEEELEEIKQEDLAEAADEPPGPPALDQAAEVPNSPFIGKAGGNPYGGGGGGGRGGSFPGQLAAAAQKALSENAKTRVMEARIPVRFWLDATGRAMRIELEGSTGDAELDATIKSVLLSVVYRSPPADVRMPVVTRVTARRPA